MQGNPPAKRPGRARGQRAKRACLACRVRKIRCDVTVHGIPCLNCKLDSEDCIVKPRAGKRQSAKAVAEYRKQQQQQQQLLLQLDLESGPSPGSFSSCSTSSPQPDLSSASITGLSADRPYESFIDMDDTLFAETDDGQHEERPGHGVDMLDECNMAVEGALGPTAVSPRDRMDYGSSTHSLGVAQPPLFLPAAKTSEPLHSFVPCICYRFVEADTAWRLGPADIAFLEQRSCFRLPEKAALAAFVAAYFRYVHPFLPVLNEAAFCTAYADQSADSTAGQRTPLFVFQAMLFISCPVRGPLVGPMGIDFGKLTASTALFDVDVFKDDVRSAQAALMLTYQAPTPNDKTSSFWLAVAVHYAQRAQAHRYLASTSAARQAVLKRLWWCCILRDKIMALGLRRPLHIQSSDFDFDHNSLNEGDFCDEILHSDVYDRPTKQVMVQLIIALCELMGPLHSILTMIDPMKGMGADSNQPTLQELKCCLARLDLWYQKAVARFQIPMHICGVNESLILFTKMIYIYYYTAKVLLCHHTIVLCVTDKDDQDAARELRLHAQSEINTARRKTTVDLMELLQRGLAQYLPNTFVAFSAFPFVWYILETKVTSSPLGNDQASQPIQTYKAIMRGFREQHESADDVLLCIQSIVKHIQEVWPPQRTHERPREYASYLLQNSYQDAVLEEISDKPQRPHDVWTDLLVGSPRRYCQILLTVDYFLSYGCFPSESDFPKVLQGLDMEKPKEDLEGGGDVDTPANFDFYQCLEQALEAVLF
ncbi:c6 zinc finger domain containing protein [Grosmannia clavigera kw1407]|uniref:C6 zinc finger domain containing protein n=1 Tax=Grosmannia clavigera (strain kw1407 / UAMH 11150) TaxID=655863 RepID=F0X789_GROCL|nr:c6 zinc finger domain containing protein [Grosmannia clavigera kw1407]EFX06482.1 c6 zinc finger domain containing protein [Grosmannia clavigera kw1407]